MRFRFPLLLALAGLATACSTESPPVRLDFVGSTNLTSSSRTVNAADTLLTRVYASSESGEPLTRLRITVDYKPTTLPIAYPTPISAYNPKSTPDDPQLVYLDSVLGSGAKEYLIQNRLGARTTSGTEDWEYTVTDAKGRTARRGYRLTVRKSDSLASFHSYTLLVRPNQSGPQGRRFLALRSGLLLPKHAVHTDAANQQLVDLVFVSRLNGFSLETLTSTDLGLSAARWPQSNRRPTVIRQTSLTRASFQESDNPDELRSAFDAGRAFASPQSTGPLAKENVLAFRVPISSTEFRYGLLLVADLVSNPAPLLTCSVRVQK